MKSFLLSIFFFLMPLCITAQTIRKASDSSPKEPQGATYTLSNGTTVSKNSETISSDTQYYNVVQVTNGTLDLNECTISKTGDGTSGDNSSFYGTNSAVYASGSNAFININGGTITTSSKGANAVFATNGATITADGITIDNSNTVSRGLHATGGGIINATNVNITTRKATSSTVATDRGGGTVTVTGGTLTAKGDKSAVIYSTGNITVSDVTGISEQGPITTVEGTNTTTIIDCDMTSNSEKRGIFLQQSGSGDAEGKQPVCNVNNSTLTMTDGSAPLCYVKNVTATATLTDVSLNIASGLLMVVPNESEGSTGTLSLQTTQDCWTYTGTVDAESYNNVAVIVGENVIWSGAIDTDNNASSAKVEVESNGTWYLTADSYVSSLTNNGIIYTNGYKLSYDTLKGSGNISSTTDINNINSVSAEEDSGHIYTIDGRRANADTKGIIIKNGKKYLVK